MGVLIECYPLSVSILPNGCDVVGKTIFPDDIPDLARRYLNKSPEKQRYLENRVMRALAGTIAHDLKYPSRRHDVGDRTDYNFANALLEESSLTSSIQHRNAYVEMLKIATRDRLRRNWYYVKAIADALLQRDQLSAEEIIHTLRSAQWVSYEEYQQTKGKSSTASQS
jgi:hypothetical protein